jgi:tape measure domain-containing protein
MASTVTVNIVGNERDLVRALNHSDDALSRFGSSVAKFGAVAAGITAATGAALAGWGLKAAADMQQVSIAFEGIMGSGEQAQAFLEDLRSFASKTPFEFPELARASKMLMATGTAAEDVIPVMTKLGNVAATLGVGGAEIEGVVRALGQMQGKGKASAEELQQISEQIPGFSAIRAIAESLGITVEEAFDKMKDGAISADVAVAAILEGMEKFPGAAGAMERQAKTLNGVLSTLKDTARDALVAGVTPALAGVTEAINKAMPAISSLMEGIGRTFGTLLERLVPALEPLLPIVQKFAELVGFVLVVALDKLGPLFEKISPHLDKFLTAIAAVAVTIIDQLAPILATLVPAVLDLATTFAEALVPILQDLMPILQVAAELLAFAAEGIDASGAAAIIAAVAVGKLMTALSAMHLGALNPYVAAAALAVGVIAGLTGAFSEQSTQIDINTQKMAKLNQEQLVAMIQQIVTFSRVTGESNLVGKAFADVLDQDTVQASRFIEAASAAGIATDGFEAKLRNHIGTTSAAAVSTAEHRARVDELSNSLYHVPPVTNAWVRAETEEAQAQLDAFHRQLEELTGQPWTVVINAAVDATGGNVNG